jgi:hypothetical protein
MHNKNIHVKRQQKMILFDCIIAIIGSASPPRIGKHKQKGWGKVFLGRVRFQEISKEPNPVRKP